MRQDTYPPDEEKQEHNLLCHFMGAGSHFVRSLGAGAIEMDLLSQAAVIADDYVKLLPDGLGRCKPCCLTSPGAIEVDQPAKVHLGPRPPACNVQPFLVESPRKRLGPII